MIKRIIVTLAALLAVFTLAATSANATPLTPNTGTGFDQPHFTGTSAPLNSLSPTCAQSPFGANNPIQSATNDSDSGKTLNLYADSSCATAPIAALAPGEGVAVTAALSYNFT